MSRNPLIDALKVLASQLIVFHHLSAYGPISDVWDAAATASSDWFFEYGRMAVQVFLVIGGFLAAQGLDRGITLSARATARQIVTRYFRLSLPLIAALAIAIPSSMLARQWADYQFFPAAPTWSQLWSHALLIHTLTADESLSAGVWYVAIDFQLYALLTVLAWLGSTFFRLWVVAIMLASLLYFNLRPEHNHWGIYFFGAYALGTVAYWCTRSEHRLKWTVLLGATGAIALSIDFRGRIALAMCIAMALVWYAHWRNASAQKPLLPPQARVLFQALSNSSYALFLVHFSVVMLGNALYAKLGLQSPASAAVTIAACWAMSMLIAMGFERWIERPLHRLSTAMHGTRICP